MPTYPDTQLLIGAAWRQAASGATIPVLDPATEEEIGTVASAGRKDLDAALAAAEDGFSRWRQVPAFERSKLMRRAAALLRERADTIAWMLTREQGKPLADSTAEVMAGADIIDWFADEARRTYGHIIPARTGNVVQTVTKLPVGPVAAFTPWNFPINQSVRKISAALAAGCSIVLKAPEETPAAPAELVRAFVDAGLPHGVINLVYGVPSEISDHLIPHPVIRKISFTGSTAVGKHLASLSGLHMKRVTMELGGHAPVIVCNDADIDRAAKLLATVKYRNAGQVCVSPTRFLVQENVREPFVEAFVEAARSVEVGNGLAHGTVMGPLANDRRVATVEQMIADAVEHGGVVATGGRRIGNKGYFFEPTVLVDVPTEARIMNEEPFGPVAIVNRFSRLDEAIAEANRLPYGLAAYGFTRSAQSAHRMDMEIEAGMLSVNHYGLGLPEIPFGGVKSSGYGTEGGSEALEPYLVSKLTTHMHP